MGKVYLLGTLFKFICELNLKEAIGTLVICEVILDIADVRTGSLPFGQLFRARRIFAATNIKCQNFHSILIQALGLVEIDQVESNLLLFGKGASDLEVKPLSMSICIYIVLQDAVVLVRGDLQSYCQVTRFKY